MKRRVLQGAVFGAIAAVIGLVVWALGGDESGNRWCPPGQFQSYGSDRCTAVPVDPTDGSGLPDGHEYLVGVGGLEPGSYITNQIDPVWGCWWERLSGPHGTPDTVIAVGYVGAEEGLPVSVIIQPTDKYFYSEGCGDWHPGEGK